MSVLGSDTAFMEENEELRKQLTDANERAEKLQANWLAEMKELRTYALGIEAILTPASSVSIDGHERLGHILQSIKVGVSRLQARIDELTAVKRENTALLSANRDLQAWFDDCNDERKKLQARIDESQKQEPVAHMYPSDLEKFNSEETFAHSFFVADGNPNETSVPVFTQPIIKPDMEELEARFDTEFRRGKALEREIEELRKQLEENHRNAGVVRHDRGVRVD